MNLLSTEQALKLINKARISSDPDVLPAAIRQIQANALRAAAAKLKLTAEDEATLRPDTVLALIMEATELEIVANQLDPQPPTP